MAVGVQIVASPTMHSSIYIFIPDLRFFFGADRVSSVEKNTKPNSTIFNTRHLRFLFKNSASSNEETQLSAVFSVENT